MASNRPHTLKDQFYFEARCMKEAEASARIVLQQLYERLGDEAYDAWVDALSDADRWPEFERKARDKLATLDSMAMPSADEVKGYWRGA